MRHALIVSGIVDRIDCNPKDGFIEVDDYVVCGMVDNGDGTFSNPEKTAEEIIAQMIKDGEALIESHIQTPIDDYNTANGVKFANAHSCANYKDEAGYPHQAFCQQSWSFNVAVWEAGRAIQTDVLAGTISSPTHEEFIVMLPVFGA